MKLRWMVEMNRVTIPEVTDRQMTHGDSFIAAKKYLENESPAMLQFYDEDIDRWEDVPLVWIYRGE